MRAVVISLALLFASCKPPPPTKKITPPTSAPIQQTPTTSQERLLADVTWLSSPSRNGRGSLSPEAKETASWIADQWRAAGLDVSLQEIPNTDGQVNVIGVLPGDERAVLFGAHYDHLGQVGSDVFLGADDNASGVALVLELSRALASYKGYTLIFVAFGAEEKGLFGSREYVARPVFPLERTRAMLNFDMVGRNFFEMGRNKEGAFAVVGAESDPSFTDLLKDATTQSNGELILVPVKLLSMIGFERSSDDYYFRQEGVPALFFSTSMHPDYHKPTDTIEKIKPSQMQLVANSAIRFLYSLP